MSLHQIVEDFLRGAEGSNADFVRLPEDLRKDFKRACGLLENVSAWYDADLDGDQ